jgi:hypothetical protein
MTTLRRFALAACEDLADLITAVVFWRVRQR